ncbi:ketoacyl-synt-domain-containing protein [Aspergillus ellipticus CBS 707.79]|uniref:Ketoacyl-synt-domain-containing protein n=1 Tax=Aspergillus ellipticus CBS 707.79 TaxID=1448320 RepID=A0A319DJ82_9EURO|nr:ketoacyl-synt-domain-containing protein [Aspergillus ellipticus CBS 707.79]
MTASTNGPPEGDVPDAIAIIGFDLKFPQDADTPENFWKLLLEGRSAMTEVPADRWNIDAFYHPDPDRLDSMHSRGGHFVKEDLSRFDAPFFSMSSAEAAAVDPAQRSLLECTYHAFESAGIPIEAVSGSRTSCFVGSFSREYDAIVNRDPQIQARYAAVGLGMAMLANRLSWFYDMRGPSLALDTACSSTLIALHLAVQSLRNGESDMSVVAGCNLIMNPDTNSIPLSNMGFMGSDGVCYSFDHRANGYARGEGTAVMVLKPVKQALRDGDLIRAVIRNTGSNQDGRTPGITQPSREAQGALIRETYLQAGLPLDKTAFFEAHGTGTAVGDPLEAGAIGDVFKDHRSEPIIVGAVKSNIGHLEGASGLAGLIKAVLALENALIPRNIWLEKLNPAIAADEWKLKFPTETMVWPGEGLRRASINSFGYGGANAHVVVDDAYHYLQERRLVGRHRTVPQPPKSVSEPRVRTEAPWGRPRLFVWSAADEGGLERVSGAYRDHLREVQDPNDEYMSNLAYTLSSRRTHLPWRSFVVANSVDDLQARLATSLSKPVRSSAGISPTLAFAFTGQGAQWYAMGRELAVYPTFASALLDAEQYLTSLGCAWKVTEELDRPEESSKINDPALAQPLCTILQVALLELLAERNITPSAVVGHSSGEIAAAYCVGALSKHSAYKVAYYRGLFTAKLTHNTAKKGSMIAVSLSETDVQPYLERVRSEVGGQLDVGCINSPKNVTLTGDESCVDHVKKLLDEEEIFGRKLPVPVAYHSPQMREIAGEYLAALHDIESRTEASPEAFPSIFSSVTGCQMNQAAASRPEYWVENMVSPVRFSSALTELCETMQTEDLGQTEVTPLALIEVGPRAALRRPIEEGLAIQGRSEVFYDSALALNVDAIASAMQLTGRLHCRGFEANIVALNALTESESDRAPIVDLPRYPFNHSQGYWTESHMSRNHRFRTHPRHELLGARTLDWNPLEAKWRHIIRVSELPWIKDHKFNGSELYPAAGMIVMAIEAARQMADPSRQIASYSLEDVALLKALLLNLSPKGVETELHLRPQKRLRAGCDRHAFHLYFRTSADWVETCHGTVVTHYKPETSPADPKLEARLRHIFPRCTRWIDSSALYENLAKYGFGFGPAFQTLRNVYYNQAGEATALIDPRDWTAKVKDSHLVQDHVIHPTALDALLHLTAVGESSGSWEPLATSVPTKIANMWISNALLAHPENQCLRVATQRTFRGYRDNIFSAAAYDSVTDECQILMDGHQSTAISSRQPSDPEKYTLGLDIDWRPDVDLLTPDQLRVACRETVTPDDVADPLLLDKEELVLLFYLQQAITKLDAGGFNGEARHAVKYIEWMKKRVEEYEAADGIKPSLGDTDYFRQLLAEIPPSLEAALYSDVGENLAEILRGEIDAMEILFSGESRAASYYTSQTFTAVNKAASTYVDLLAHKDPSIKILEVGAGTGGLSASILGRLALPGKKQKRGLRCTRYTYTDISPGFFEAATERFRPYSDQMEFRVLDVEKDPVEQGFDAAAYDVVVASAVLHATPYVTAALGNVHRLLKPNGKLVLVEPSNPTAARLPFVFGLLPSWWLSVEEYRYWGPLISDDEWDTELKKVGFRGADVYFRDYPDHRHNLSFIVSVAESPTLPPVPMPNTVILLPDHSPQHHPLAMALQTSLQGLGSNATILPYDEVISASIEDAFCISLLEIETPFLATVQAPDWQRLQTIVRLATGILWVTQGRDGNPALGLVTGLSRTIRTELPQLPFIELALEDSCTVEMASEHITHVFHTCVLTPGPVDEKEAEYEERNGILHINRVTDATWLTDHVAAGVLLPTPHRQALRPHRSETLSLKIRSPGVLTSFYFKATQPDHTPLAADEVEIQVQAFGISFKDCMVALGQVPANSLGLEFSGSVLRVGSGVSRAEFQPGDRVCGLAPNAFATRLRTAAAALMKIPSHLSFSTAAALPLSFTIAYHALSNLANLKQGESVLILSGAGGVGQAAIQLARLAGADIYTTVGTAEKKELLMQLYHIPADHIIVGDKNTPFAPELQRRVDGVDVILTSLGWENLHQSLECLLPFGRIIDISASDRRDWEAPPARLFASNITYATIDLALILTTSTPLVASLLSSISKLLSSSTLSAPSPLQTFTPSTIEDAFRLLQSGTAAGKAVIELDDDDIVPVTETARPASAFRADASYVIAGGLGGLGQNTARWMVQRGARHLILLSRSGPKGHDAATFLHELRERGVTVATPACDIADRDALESVLHACAETMPPVRGCIQATTVMGDTLFSTMPVETYHATLRPKTTGSWNLHALLPFNLDFFILLASGSGITGTRGQSNYASANTYQDALARHRLSRGQRAIALDLGLLVDIGMAASSANKDSMTNITKLGYRGLLEKEYLRILDCPHGYRTPSIVLRTGLPHHWKEY